MSSNPYQSPGMMGNPQPTNRLQAPAIALLIITGLSIGILGLSLAFDVFMLASGMVDNWEDAAPGMSKRAQVTIRTVWGVLILLSNTGSFVGGLQMLWLKNRALAWTGCILACIPCFSPCLIFGIPFGIWGLIAMSDEQVKNQFES